ncbi:MAG: CocE/NonD family hydrolase [Alkaliphilus sp.]
MSRKKILAVIIIVILGGVFVVSQNSSTEKVSKFGQYSGYSKPVFDGHVRKSDFLVLSDGTKLAYDLLLPTKKGVIATNPLPVLFCYSTYLRAFSMINDGKVIDNEIMNMGVFRKTFIWLRAKFRKDGHIFDYSVINPWVKKMLKHGYAVVIVEQRGTGASQGSVDPSLKAMSKDADEVLSWIERQSWSDGKIGMFGKSSLAISQYAAAAANNPHLKAIFPISSPFDMYDSAIYPGGILNLAFINIFELSTEMLESMIVPVNSEIEPREKKKTFSYIMTKLFRESKHRNYNKEIWQDLSLYKMLDEINKSGVAIYNATGWFDIFTRDAILWYNNLTVPQKLYISNTDHFILNNNEIDGLDMGSEAHRWFDYWLKGIDNGIMEESPVHYYVIGEGWRSASGFPLENTKKSRFFLDTDSAGNGLLVTQRAESNKSYAAYVADYSVTSGRKSRWNSVVEAADYSNFAINDDNALVYTSTPFEENKEIIGHPVVTIVISTEEDDLDFFVYLKEIDVNGRITYLTEGHLRASCRKITTSPFNNLDLPYQSGLREEIELLPSNIPVKLYFDLLPIAKKIKKGSRISLAITLADYGNFETAIIEPAPRIKVLHNSIHQSFLDIPMSVLVEGDVN